MKTHKIFITALTVLILLAIAASALLNPDNQGLTTPCNLDFTENYTGTPSSINGSYYPPACWNTTIGFNWWGVSPPFWGWAMNCDATPYCYAHSDGGSVTGKQRLSSSFFNKSEDMKIVSWRIYQSGGTGGGCSAYLSYGNNGTQITENPAGSWPGSWTWHNYTMSDSLNGEELVILFDDDHDFSICLVDEIKFFDQSDREMSFWSGSINAYPIEFEKDFHIDVTPSGGTGEAYYVVFARESGTTDWTCDASTFGSANLSDSLSIDMQWLSDDPALVDFSVNITYDFKIGWFNHTIEGGAAAYICNDSSDYLILFSDTANATAYECYDQGETPYSEDCESLYGNQLYRCTSAGVCSSDYSGYVCAGKGHGADCVGLYVPGLVSACTFDTCWCDWLTWQEPECAMKVDVGEVCYTGYACKSSVCTGYDSGIACNCGNEGCTSEDQDCLYGNSAGPASDSCWYEGVCLAEGGAGTGMYLNLTNHLTTNNTITLNWTKSESGDFFIYVLYYNYEFPSSKGYVKELDANEECDEDEGILFITDINQSYVNMPACGFGTVEYQAIVWDAAFEPINWSNWVSVQASECEDNGDCDWGEFCSEGRCIPVGECLNDSDCGTSDEFCESPYTIYANFADRGFTCQDRRSDGDYCHRDYECESNNCSGVLESAETCEFGSDPDNPWSPLDYCTNLSYTCMSDEVCRQAGTCSSPDSYCSTSDDCDTLKGDYDYWCYQGTCVPDNLDGGSCATGGNKSCLGFEASIAECLVDQCVDDDWECNYDLLGCPDENYCNGSTEESPGNTWLNHQCVSCTNDGNACTGSEECCFPIGQCLGGLCVPANYECRVNNPPTTPSMMQGYQWWESYCDNEGSNTALEWCYREELSYGIPAGQSAIPDHQCYIKYEGGALCSEDYQCVSLDCDEDTNSCTGDAPCVPGEPGCGELLGDSKVIVFIGSITNPVTTMRAGEANVLKAALYGKDGEQIVGGEAKCKFSSAGIYSTTTSFMPAGSLYYQQNIKASNNQGYYPITVQCYTGDSCSYEGENICVSNSSYYITIQSESWSFIDCSCAQCFCPTRNSAAYEEGADDMYVKVVHRKGNNVVLYGSTCNLTTDYNTNDAAETYTMPKDVGGYIYRNVSINVPYLSSSSSEEAHTYKITCDDGTHNATYTNYFIVVGETCENGEQDEGEEGVDCGGVCPEDCESHCFDGDLNGGETDVDCGGPDCKKCDDYEDCERDRDCKSDYCHPCEENEDYGETAPYCRQPRCNDGCENGDEDGVDCGGDCDPCGCASNSDCDTDGSEHCEIVTGDIFGYCETDTCSNNNDCDPLQWAGEYSQRYCDTSETPAVCKFGSGDNECEDCEDVPDMLITPLSGTSYINDSSTIISVHICEEEGEKGYRVATNMDTLKHYLVNTVDLTPSIPGFYDYEVFSGSEVYEKVTIDSLDEYICDIPSGYDYAWNSVTILASPRNQIGQSWMSETVHGISFREPFEVDVGRYTGNLDNKWFYFNLSRDGYCNYSNYAWEEYQEINAVASEYILFNYDNSSDAKPLPNFRYRCVSTYGEVVEGFYTYNPLDFFQWQTWMIYIIVFILMIPVPLILLLVIRSRGRRRQGDESE